jgi:two-component system, chemotaxis family, sensor kinase CheA
MSASVDLREFVAGFLVEAEEHLRASGTNLLAVEEATRRGAASPRAVRDQGDHPALGRRAGRR